MQQKKHALRRRHCAWQQQHAQAAQLAMVPDVRSHAAARDPSVKPAMIAATAGAASVDESAGALGDTVGDAEVPAVRTLTLLEPGATPSAALRELETAPMNAGDAR